jgi:hypothetical protein
MHNMADVADVHHSKCTTSRGKEMIPKLAQMKYKSRRS